MLNFLDTEIENLCLSSIRYQVETNLKNILQNIVFYAFIFQSSHLFSSGGLPHCFQATKKRALPSLPQTQEEKEAKRKAFDNLLQEADTLGLTAPSSLKPTESHAEIDVSTSPQSSPISYANIEYYHRFPLQPNSANELIIISDGMPQTFLKHYNQDKPSVEINLYPADISLLEYIHGDAKKITEDPPSFTIKIDNQSYGVHYLTFNNDCRSLGEQIKDITPIESSDYTGYSLVIDQNNMVTLNDTIIERSLLLRCTEFQFNHIATTELLFCIDVLDSRYTITSINNNGLIRELIAKKESSYDPLPSDVPAKPESTEKEKEEYRNMLKKIGKTPPSKAFAKEPVEQTCEPKSFISQRWFLIGGAVASSIVMATLLYFFLATYPQHQ